MDQTLTADPESDRQTGRRGHRGPDPRRPGLGRSPAGRLQLGAVLGLMVGAIAMFASAALTQTTGSVVPVLTPLATAPVPESQLPVSLRKTPPATPGTCLTWQRSDAADALLVDCGASHLFEQAGAVQLAQFPAGAPLPGDSSFRNLVNQSCVPLVVKYLHGAYDPSGAYRAGALKPSAKSWADGDRALRCGLQRFSRSGALYPITGKVASHDQADIHATGTCLGIDGKFIGDPVDCSQPHAVQSVGFVDLASKFTKGYPKQGEQDSVLQPACTKMATAFAGGDQALSTKNLVVMWGTLSQASWD
ncbi:MAG TPA: septum formation family protein, partial [Pseudonocardia sp.]